MDCSEWQLEMDVGETLQIGDVRVTIVDVDGDHVCFHIETPDAEWEESLQLGASQVDLR